MLTHQLVPSNDGDFRRQGRVAVRGQLKSFPSWSSTFVDLLGPPMEAGGRANEIRSVLKRDAASELRVFQVLDAGEVLVDEGSIGQWPQVLGRL